MKKRIQDNKLVIIIGHAKYLVIILLCIMYCKGRGVEGDITRYNIKTYLACYPAGYSIYLCKIYFIPTYMFFAEYIFFV